MKAFPLILQIGLRDLLEPCLAPVTHVLDLLLLIPTLSSMKLCLLCISLQLCVQSLRHIRLVQRYLQNSPSS